MLVFRINQLVEVALLAFRCLFLVHQRHPARVELVEPFIPRDLLERRVVRMRRARKLKANDPGLVIALGAGDHRRFAAAGLGPLPYLIVVLRGLGECHECLPPRCLVCLVALWACCLPAQRHRSAVYN